MNKTLFSSNSEEWATPGDFFEELNREFKFDLDPCATAENHKTLKFFTKEQNGLLQDWGGAAGFLQSALRPENRELDREGIRRRAQRRNDRRSSYSGKDRHEVFSRLHPEPVRNQIRKRPPEVRRGRSVGAVPFNGRYLQGAGNVKAAAESVRKEGIKP